MNHLYIILISVFVSLSQSGGSALTSNINVSPKIVALNGSNSASIVGISALQLNTAGLNTESYETSVSSLNYFAGIKFYEIGIAIPTSSGTFGFRLKSMHSGNELVTTADNIDGTGETWTYKSTIADLAYANKFSFGLSYGVNLKFINEDIYTVKLNTWAVDFGLFFVYKL